MDEFRVDVVELEFKGTIVVSAGRIAKGLCDCLRSRGITCTEPSEGWRAGQFYDADIDFAIPTHTVTEVACAVESYIDEITSDFLVPRRRIIDTEKKVQIEWEPVEDYPS